ARDTGRRLRDDPRPAGGQSRGRAGYDVHDPGVLDTGCRTARGADGEVGVAVAVEVPGRERGAEAGVCGHRPGDARRRLGAGPCPAGLHTGGAAGQHLDHARIGLAGEVLARDTDDDVGIAVAVEVTGRDHRAEAVTRLRRLGNARSVLGDDPAAASGDA